MSYIMIGSIIIWLLGMAVTFYLLSKANPFLAAFGTFFVSILGFVIAEEFSINYLFPGTFSILLLGYVVIQIAYAFK